MRFLLLVIFTLFVNGCDRDFAIKQPDQPKEKYKLIEGSYWTTSKAGTVLSVKTMFRINVETGETKYLDEGVWQSCFDR